MANLGSVKVIKNLPKPQIMIANIEREIAKQLIPVGRQHVNERKKVVSNFEHHPEFDNEIKITNHQVRLEILVINSGEQVSDSFTIGNLWLALDKTGIRPHTITSKNPQGRLAFMWGGPGSYQPKTRPIARSGGPGRVNRGEMVFRKSVNHPGFKPRKFSESINRRLRRQFEQAIDRGVRLGSRKRR